MPRFPATLAYSELDTPIGSLLLAGETDALCLVSFPIDRYRNVDRSGWTRDDAALAEPRRQLQAYFAGELTDFDLPLRFLGTDFQNQVWQALTEIPYGETTNYGAIAARIGRPPASRAVGAANGANHLPIIVPCHRVVGSTGALTGFGGGLPTKRYLLAHERKVAGVADATSAPPGSGVPRGRSSPD